MADAYIGILLELYDTHQATAYSNLVVGIVFGESSPNPKILFARLMMAHRRLFFFFFKHFASLSMRLLAPLNSNRKPCTIAGAYSVFYGTSLYVLL